MPGSKPYRIDPRAQQEIIGADDWYAQRSTDASVAFIDAVLDSLANISQAPRQWPKYLYGTRRLVLHSFPFSIVYLDQRRLGSSILNDRIVRYREDKGLNSDFEEFSEKELVDHFKGEQRAMTRYVLDSVRNAITHSPDNKLRDFVEYAGKSSEKPFSYSAIEKTFYSQFIYGKMLDTKWSHKADIGENPRELEKTQIIRLMSLIADKIYVGKYDDEIGSRRLENKVQSGEDVPEPHLRAYRMAREEILYCWINYIGQIIEHHLLTMGKVINSDKIFQYPLPEQLWVNIGNFIENLARRPLWIDRATSLTLFGGKQTYAFWQAIFETGTSTGGQEVMPAGLNIIDMIKA